MAQTSDIDRDVLIYKLKLPDEEGKEREMKCSTRLYHIVVVAASKM